MILSNLTFELLGRFWLFGDGVGFKNCFRVYSSRWGADTSNIFKRLWTKTKKLKQMTKQTDAQSHMKNEEEALTWKQHDERTSIIAMKHRKHKSSFSAICMLKSSFYRRRFCWKCGSLILPVMLTFFSFQGSVKRVTWELFVSQESLELNVGLQKQVFLKAR